MLKDLGARVVLIEEEPFSLAAAQWSRAAKSLSIPYGVQLAETLPRSLPSPVAASRDRVLRDAAFVVARSPAAATLASTWGATGDVVVIAHGVDEAPMRPDPSGPFTVAFVGRLVEEKGVDDLLAAARQLDGVIRVVVAGDGPLAGRVRSAGSGVELLGAVPHDRIGDVYAQAHVTCVPSRTTPRWEEQFGRVLVESLVRGVPVVAASTGEIPWVLGLTGGGTLVRESDPAGLADALTRLADDPLGTAELGRTGRSGVLAHFTNRAAAHTLLEVLGRLSGR
jgi:glycosyltransferase involved in cell wall biosynthesis